MLIFGKVAGKVLGKCIFGVCLLASEMYQSQLLVDATAMMDATAAPSAGGEASNANAQIGRPLPNTNTIIALLVSDVSHIRLRGLEANTFGAALTEEKSDCRISQRNGSLGELFWNDAGLHESSSNSCSLLSGSVM
jgi:hypothetical protein